MCRVSIRKNPQEIQQTNGALSDEKRPLRDVNKAVAPVKEFDGVLKKSLSVTGNVTASGNVMLSSIPSAPNKTTADENAAILQGQLWQSGSGVLSVKL